MYLYIYTHSILNASFRSIYSDLPQAKSVTGLSYRGKSVTVHIQYIYIPIYIYQVMHLSKFKFIPQ